MVFAAHLVQKYGADHSLVITAWCCLFLAEFAARAQQVILLLLPPTF